MNVDISTWDHGLIHLSKQPVGLSPDTRIIGVDPGVRDLISCTSIGRGRYRGREGKEIRKATTYTVSNKEYQYRRGAYRAQDLELGRRLHEDMQPVYDRAAQSLKTVNPVALVEAMLARYNIRNRIVEFNNGFNHRETRMYLYSQRQVALTRIGQELQTLGSFFTHLSPHHHNHNQVAKEGEVSRTLKIGVSICTFLFCVPVPPPHTSLSM